MIDFDAPSNGSYRPKKSRRLSSKNQHARKLAALAVVLAGTATSHAKVIYVNGAVATSGNGTSWNKAYKYLRDALADPSVGPSNPIWVAKGTYFPDDTAEQADVLELFGNREVSFELKGEYVYGGFNGTETSLAQRDPVANETILSGAIWSAPGDEVYWSLSVVMVNESSSLDGLTVQDGNANGSAWWQYPRIPAYDRGAGCTVLAEKSLTLANCRFTNNFALEFGGAIFMQGGATSSGRVIATNCVFDNNGTTSDVMAFATRAGGAIYGKVTATNCEFSDNVVFAERNGEGEVDGDGGAIFGDAILTGCLFKDNAVTGDAANGNATADGGAISGDVTATGCTFSGNSSFALAPDGPNNKINLADASGGAISGNLTGKDCRFDANSADAEASYGGAVRGIINIADCGFTANFSTTGRDPNPTAVPPTDPADYVGGGGALDIEDGASNVMNCVFVKNTTRFRGGAIHHEGRREDDGTITSTLVLSNSTFVDNGVTATSPVGGAALSVEGIVRILNNIFWSTADTSGTFNQRNLIHVVNRGVLRNSDLNYPTPATVCQNLIYGANIPPVAPAKGAISADSPFGDANLGNISTTVVTGSPAFVNIADPDGADDKWGTPDDGLRLTSVSSAIGTAQDSTISYRNFLQRDNFDVDDDKDTGEFLPSDIAGYARKQGFVDMGAYEFGEILNVQDIAVTAPDGTILVDNTGVVDFSAFKSVTRTFTIKNAGRTTLTGLAVTKSGTNAAAFTVTSPAKIILAADETTTFTVTFAPGSENLHTAALMIASNDPDESPFDIALQGQTLLPDVVVTQSGTTLVDGVSNVNFGSVIGAAHAVKTFTVTNPQGNSGNVTIGSITASGAGAANFVSSAAGQSVLAPGESTTFTVDFSSLSDGVKKALVTIATTDPNGATTFQFNVTGTRVGPPQIAISQPFGSDVAKNATIAFGAVKQGELYSKKFVIRNDGTSDLKGVSLSISGAKEFKLTKPSATVIKPGKTASFTVTFKPTSTAKKTAAVQILSNDQEDSPFSISFSGSGSKAAKGKVNSKSALVEATKTKKSGSSDQSTSVVVDEDGIKYLTLTVEKTADFASRPVQVSSNLMDWYSGDKFTTTLVDSKKLLQVRDNTPTKKGEKRYIRLKPAAR